MAPGRMGPPGTVQFRSADVHMHTEPSSPRVRAPEKTGIVLEWCCCVNGDFWPQGRGPAGDGPLAQCRRLFACQGQFTSGAWAGEGRRGCAGVLLLRASGVVALVRPGPPGTVQFHSAVFHVHAEHSFPLALWPGRTG
jgi:hypothetical protein